MKVSVNGAFDVYRSKYLYGVINIIIYMRNLDDLVINAFDLMNRLSIIYADRQQWKVDHKRADILLLTICTVIVGCEGWKEIADVGNGWLDMLSCKMDVAMREDDCRIRRGSAAEMLTGFRHMAVNMLNNAKTFNAVLRRKQKKAGMSTQYLSEFLAVCEAS